MQKPYLHALKTASIAALFVGLLVGGLMFYVAGQHNPQQEFHGAEWSSAMSWVLVFLTGFGAGFVVAFAAVFGAVCGLNLLRYRKDAGVTLKSPFDETAPNTQSPSRNVASENS